MLSLGIDPGPTSCAWALLREAEHHRWDVVALGDFESHMSSAWVAGAQRWDYPRPDVWCLERPHYAPIGGKGHVGLSIALAVQLVDTAWAGARIVGWLEALGLGVVTLTCLEVRRALLGRRTATDAMVKAALWQRIMLPRCNEHQRDAMAVALVGVAKARAGGKP